MLHLGGMLYEQRADAADGQAIFRVPPHGRLGLSWSLPRSDGNSAYRVMVQPAPKDGKVFGRRGRKADGSRRNRLVYEISGATLIEGHTELALLPGDWVLMPEKSVAKPAKGPWTVIGESVNVKVDLESTPRVQLGESR